MSPRFRVLDYVVDPSLNRITTPSGQTVQVEPKIMDVLVALADHADEVVTRDELMQRVWNGIFVSDDALHRAIRELRRVFDDDADAPRVIETIRKRGYRLLPQVQRVGATAGSKAAVNGGSDAVSGSRGWTQRFGVAVLIGAVAVGVAVWWQLGRRATVQTEARVRFTPLTSDPGNEVDPALSPSGR